MRKLSYTGSVKCFYMYKECTAIPGLLLCANLFCSLWKRFIFKAFPTQLHIATQNFAFQSERNFKVNGSKMQVWRSFSPVAPIFGISNKAFLCHGPHPRTHQALLNTAVSMLPRTAETALRMRWGRLQQRCLYEPLFSVPSGPVSNV